jgi:hypothetical protein
MECGGKAIPLYASPVPAQKDELQSIREIIANDSFAISFQTMGQYRTALLKKLTI